QCALKLLAVSLQFFIQSRGALQFFFGCRQFFARTGELLFEERQICGQAFDILFLLLKFLRLALTQLFEVIDGEIQLPVLAPLKNTQPRQNDNANQIEDLQLAIHFAGSRISNATFSTPAPRTTSST